MKFYGDTIACIGTGPSLTLSQVEAVRARGFALFGCNNVHQVVPDLQVLFATNAQWWDYYWGRDDGPRMHACEKWTNNLESAERYRLNYIRSWNAPGLSTNPRRIHHGHSSGFCLLNLAFLAGAKRIILLGYDMRYAADYDGRERKIGSNPRHYFGEYNSALQHWPKVSVRDGVHVELIKQYEAVAKQGFVEIVNCSPDSALNCFPALNIDEVPS